MAGMDGDGRCGLLRELLVAHRSRWRRDQVGLAAAPRALSEGLSQEDLAELTGLGLGVIQRLEAGRGRPEPAVLDTVAAALRMDPVDRAMLYELALGHPPEAGGFATEMDAALWVRLRRWDGPAVAVDALFRVLGVNDAARLWLAGCRPGVNLARWLLQHPHARHVFTHWAPVARWVVAQLRPLAARFSGERRVSELVSRLRRDDAVDGMWREPGLSPATLVPTTLRRPDGQVDALLLSTLVPGPDDERRVVAFAALNEASPWPARAEEVVCDACP